MYELSLVCEQQGGSVSEVLKASLGEFLGLDLTGVEICTDFFQLTSSNSESGLRFPKLGIQASISC